MLDPAKASPFQILTCDCQGTNPLNLKDLSAAAGQDVGFSGTQICRQQIDRFKSALATGQPVLMSCTQEAPLFLEVAEEAGFGGDLRFVNIREKAGWSAEADTAGPKMGALVAEAMLNVGSTRTVTMSSEGVVLVLGCDAVALEAAQRLAARMDVTLLLTEAPDMTPPRTADVPIYRGRAVHARGHLGAFEIEVGDFAPVTPSAKARIAFEPATTEKSLSRCDIILDLRNDAPLFPAADKRDGYFKIDRNDPAAVARALFDISDLVGEFEKPLYVAYDQSICAHSRNNVVGCSRCLDNCPTGAITPQGNGVAIEPHICAGCGNCASVCPTGAAHYALPANEHLLMRLRTLLRGYRAGGGRRPVLLVHDGQHGEEMIGALARHYDGLPANVLPVAVNAVGQCGPDMLLAAPVFGAAGTLLLTAPGSDDDLAGLREAAGLSNHILAALGYADGQTALVDERDPEALAALLHTRAKAAVDGPPLEAFYPLGGKRSLMSLALSALHAGAPAPVDEIALPAGAPFGTVDVDVDNCTLCMACAGVCPANALRDNPEYPRLAFVESACVQCGLCARTCPEKVITLRPRLDFTRLAKNPHTIKEEEPFECIRCGTPFATKSMIQTVQQRMSSHAMFADAKALRRLQMCADCRVIDMAESQDDPFAAGPRPAIRTTDDDLRRRELGIADDDGDQD